MRLLLYKVAARGLMVLAIAIGVSFSSARAQTPKKATVKKLQHTAKKDGTDSVLIPAPPPPPPPPARPKLRVKTAPKANFTPPKIVKDSTK